MSLDRQLLAIVETNPTVSSATGTVLSSWAFWQTLMERGTTVFSFAAAIGGFALFVYNWRAARRKKRLKSNLPCMKCGYDR